MSWIATLSEPPDRWVYTHSINSMIGRALEGRMETTDSSPESRTLGATWYKRLDGMKGTDSVEFLGEIVVALEAHPELEQMNPSTEDVNGTYNGILEVLKGMLARARECPDMIWTTAG